jgi:hypothetical protein
MDTDRRKMLQECTDKYQVRERTDGGIEIHIEVPRPFRDLWIVRLSDLTTTDLEIEQYSKDVSQ